MSDDDHEPIFIRSKWGTSRYVYNPRNPIGRFLIAATLIGVIVMMLALYPG